MTLLTHLTHQLSTSSYLDTLIEDEKIIAGEKIIDLLQVINFLYSWSVLKKKDKKKIYIELCFFFKLYRYSYNHFV